MNPQVRRGEGMSHGRQLVIWLGALVVFCLLLFWLRDALMPFVTGMAIAYLLDPLCDRLERWRLGPVRITRAVAALLVLFGFALLFTGFLLLLWPLLAQQAIDFFHRIPTYAETLQQRILPWVQSIRERLGLGGAEDMNQMVSERGGELLQWLGGALGQLVSGGLAVFNVLALVVLTPVVAFYLLRDWDRMMARLDTWLPRAFAGTIRELAHEADATIAGYVRGQMLVCLSLGAFYAVGLTLVGLDFGLVIGLIGGLISFIPFVGTWVGGVLAIGMAMAQFPPDWISVGIVAGVFVVGQAIEGNVLSPKLVGDRVGLHPVWIMFALVAGGSVFGFTGVLLAVPVAAVLGVLCRFFLRKYLASPLYHGAPRVPPPAGDAP